jgi:hypothetical protein
MIEFEPQTHTYQIDGRTVPSVTQVLEQIQTLEHIPPATLERARIRGQHVHEAMALLVRNDLDWDSLDEELVPYVEAGQRFLNESGIVVLGSELRVGCPVARCAGTIDLYGVLRKDEVIVDFKATADVPEPVGPQTAGYDYLYEKSYGGGKRTRKRKRLCVRLRPDGKYKVDRLGDSDDYNVFFSCLNLWHWRNKHWR